MSSLGPAAYPMRHPVIAYALDTPLMVTLVWAGDTFLTRLLLNVQHWDIAIRLGAVCAVVAALSGPQRQGLTRAARSSCRRGSAPRRSPVLRSVYR